jgi:hypothetical protein
MNAPLAHRLAGQSVPFVHVRVMQDAVRGLWDSGTKVLVPPGGKPPTLLALYEAVDVAPEDYRQTLTARIDGIAIPRDRWHRVRPKPGTFVTFAPPITGKFGKIFGALAAIVLLAGSLFIPGGWAAAPGLFAGTKMGKFLIGLAAIGVNMALQGLARPKEDSKYEKPLGFASVENTFEPGAPFKLWMGTFKDALQITVPLFTEIDGDDQLATVGFSALGFFSTPKFYAGDVEITTVQDREMVIWEANAGDPAPPEVQALVSNTKVERQHQISLSEWEIEENDANENDDAQLLDGTLEETEPLWHMVETLDDVEIFRLEYLWSNGLVHHKGGTEPNDNGAFVVLRHRMALRAADGSWGAWINLPQLTVRAKRAAKGVRVQFYVHWVDAYPPAPVAEGDPDVGNGWPGSASGVTDYKAVMGWGDVFQQSDWLAASGMLTVAGDGFAEWWWESQEKVHLYLLKSQYPLGRYKFEVKRSWPGIWSTYQPNGYYSGGVVSDALYAHAFFGEGGGYYVNDFFAPVTVPGESTLKVPVNPAKMQQGCTLTTVQNGWAEFPIVPKGTRKTHVFVRVRNQEVGTIKAVWTRLIDDWDGTAWIADQPSRNPASAYRDVLRGPHNANPVPDALINAATLQYWHERNVTRSNECNMMLPGGGSVIDALRAIALTGYARPVYAPQHTVVIDEIREEGPVGLISSRSASGFSFESLLDEKPHAFEVSYSDEFSDYEVKTVRVYAPGYNEDGSGGLTMATRIQATTYPGITTEAKAIDRGDRDLRWIYYRSMPLTCTQALAFREHEPGDLVMVETEILGRKAGRGRIVDITYTGGGDGFRDIPDVRDETHPRFVRKGDALVSAFTIDERPYFGPAQGAIRLVDDVRALADVRDYPFLLGVELRERNGDVSVHQVFSFDLETNAIVLSTPATLDIAVGDEVITGKYDVASDRMLVWDIVPRGRKQAHIMLLAYAEREIYYPGAPEGVELVTDPLFGGQIVYDNNTPVWDEAA